jgi:hypothetical protein
MLTVVEHLHLRQEDQLFVSHSDVLACSWLKLFYLLLAAFSAVGLSELAVLYVTSICSQP